MSGSRFVGDYEQIQLFRNTLATFLEQTRESWGSIRSQLAELEAENWQGDEADTFREMFDQLDGALGASFDDIQERHLVEIDGVLTWLEGRNR
jgi:uncharacterized protein YukE